MKYLAYFVALAIAYVNGEKPDMSVESFTCNHKYETPENVVKVGDSIYADTDSWTIQQLKGMQRLADTYVVRTAQADAKSKDTAIAVFQSQARIQYLLALPEGAVPGWVTKANWIQLQGASIDVRTHDGSTKVFQIYQKKYAPNDAMSIGAIDRQDDQMAFLLYNSLVDKHDNGVIPHNANTPAIKCKADGDPHYADFKGIAFDFGDEGHWHHFLQAKDCAFDIQVTANKGSNPNNGQLVKTAIRFYNDLVLYDHATGVIKQYIGGKTTVKDIGAKAFKVENADLGIQVDLRNHYGGIHLTMQSGFYSENSDGLCGVANTHPFKANAENTKHVCGGNGQTQRQRAPVHNSQILWNYNDKQTQWNAIPDASQQTCNNFYCVDPNKELNPEDPQYPETTECAAPIVGNEGVIDDKNPDSECNAIDTACKGLHHDVIMEGMTKCRTMLLANPWRSDCNCIMDYCLTKQDPIALPAGDAPCVVSEVNENHVVAHGNYDYATIDFADPKAPSGTECQSTSFYDAESKGQDFAQVPFGWEVVPKDDNNVAELIKTNTFGTKCIITAHDEPFPVAGFTECGKHEILSRQQDDYYKCYAVKMCPSRVLIRRVTTTVLAPTKPSLLGWNVKVGGQTVATVGNRGFKDGSLENWVEKYMVADTSKASKIVHDLNKDNNLVLNFAREVKANEYFLCMSGGNTKKSTIGSIDTTIESQPAVPFFWMSQAENAAEDRFLPVLHGHKLTAKNVFREGRGAHGYCVGPLDTTGRFCYELTLSNAKELKKVHVVGPNKDNAAPVKSFYEAALTAPVKMTICPMSSTKPFNNGNCKASDYVFGQ